MLSGVKEHYYEGCRFYPLPENAEIEKLMTAPMGEVDLGDGEFGFEPSKEIFADYWLVFSLDRAGQGTRLAEVSTKEQALSFITLLQDVLKINQTARQRNEPVFDATQYVYKEATEAYPHKEPQVVVPDNTSYEYAAAFCDRLRKRDIPRVNAYSLQYYSIASGQNKSLRCFQIAETPEDLLSSVNIAANQFDLHDGYVKGLTINHTYSYHSLVKDGTVATVTRRLLRAADNQPFNLPNPGVHGQLAAAEDDANRHCGLDSETFLKLIEEDTQHSEDYYLHCYSQAKDPLKSMHIFLNGESPDDVLRQVRLVSDKFGQHNACIQGIEFRYTHKLHCQVENGIMASLTAILRSEQQNPPFQPSPVKWEKMFTTEQWVANPVKKTKTK